MISEPRLIGRRHAKPKVINTRRVSTVCRVYSGSLSAEERANERVITGKRSRGARAKRYLTAFVVADPTRDTYRSRANGAPNRNLPNARGNVSLSFNKRHDKAEGEMAFSVTGRVQRYFFPNARERERKRL